MKETAKNNSDKRKTPVRLTRRGEIAAVAGTAAVSLVAGGVIGALVEHSRDVVNQNPNTVLNGNNQPQNNDRLLDAIQRHRQQMDNDTQILGKTGQLK